MFSMFSVKLKVQGWNVRISRMRSREVYECNVIFRGQNMQRSYQREASIAYWKVLMLFNIESWSFLVVEYRPSAPFNILNKIPSLPVPLWT